MRGDSNGDGLVDVSDVVAILLWLFDSAREPGCYDAADVDDSGTINMADAVAELGFLFQSDKPPAAPFPSCGGDATPDDLQSDFLHTNAVVYHARLDQIALSVPSLGEVWIVDHGTSTADR